MPKGKAVKLPANAGPVTPKPAVLVKNEASFRKETEKFVDSLLESDWQPYCGRPRNDLVGYFVIFQWRNKERLWVPLLADDGKIANRLNKIFSVKNNEPISKYLTSFPKVHRNLIWIKWQETALGRDMPDMEDVLKVLAMKYNNGERPAFNFDKDDVTLPANFSILG